MVVDRTYSDLKGGVGLTTERKHYIKMNEFILVTSRKETLINISEQINRELLQSAGSD